MKFTGFLKNGTCIVFFKKSDCITKMHVISDSMTKFEGWVFLQVMMTSPIFTDFSDTVT